MAVPPGDRRCSGTHPQLPKNSVDVVFHGFFGKEEFFRDLSIGQTTRRCIKDCSLPFGEAERRRGGWDRSRGSGTQRGDQSRRSHWGERTPSAVQYFTQCPVQLV